MIGMPHEKPKKKPKLMMNFSSRSPTSRNMRLDSSGRFSRWRMTISLTSSRWSMLPPIRSTTTSWTIPGSCSCTRSWTAWRTPRRQVVPQLRLLLLHRPLDEVADVVARRAA